MRRDDWEAHFHPVWDRFLAAKRSFDPDGILAPGHAIFDGASLSACDDQRQ
jgi:FAD/FMN-containing dehydrogenase